MNNCLRIAAALLPLASLTAVEHARMSDNLVVHEWGTFTSVASENGRSMEWAALLGPADLPCFVEGYSHSSPKTLTGFVRMETPVLYFYSPQPTALSVGIRFPQGWITDWYPRANEVMPVEPGINRPPRGFRNGSIRWNSVQVLPTGDPRYPTGTTNNHYYAARETDANPVRVGEQSEKFLFYRGIGDFQAPIRPMFNGPGRLRVANILGETIPIIILFENIGGKIGYRVARGLKDAVTLDRPELSADARTLREQFVSVLVNEGLYPKEAAAMLETWRNSWFEEGLRVFYVVPRSLVDSVLPLEIQPAPSSLERVFVGRVELLSRHSAERIEAAAASGDTRTLAAFGRFLHPFSAQIERTTGKSLQTSAYGSVRDQLLEQRLRGPVCVP